MTKHKILIFLLMLVLYSSSVVFADTLKPGSKGPEVRALQVRLKELGYYRGSINGSFDSKLRDAVKVYQRRKGFIATGQVDAVLSRGIFAGAGGSVTKVSTYASGSELKQAQTTLKQMGLYKGAADGKYTSAVIASIGQFQKKYGLKVTGKLDISTGMKLSEISKGLNMSSRIASGDTALASVFGRGYIARKGQTVSSTQKTQQYIEDDKDGVLGNTTDIGNTRGEYRYNPGSGHVELLDWWTVVDSRFSVGAVAKAVDVRTGKSFMIVRTYGKNHADCEALTKADSAKMREIWGGSWNWSRRPIVVEIGGRKIAASMAGMPHAGLDEEKANEYINNRSDGFGTGYNLDKIKNNGMDGVFDVHFLNSRTHGTNSVDMAHQMNLLEAMGK